MKTLQEAWEWYSRNLRLLELMSRIGRRYWDDLPESMVKDDRFRDLVGGEVENDAEAVLAELDDLAIFVIFSVFESLVRAYLWNQLTLEVESLTHPALIRMAGRMKQNVEEGSFYNNVLDLYKQKDHDLVEKVNQVRKYRNWVAHGRREEKKLLNLTPREALERLTLFLISIGHPEPSPIAEL